MMLRRDPEPDMITGSGERFTQITLKLSLDVHISRTEILDINPENRGRHRIFRIHSASLSKTLQACNRQHRTNYPELGDWSKKLYR
jgi:hypothetical protein